MSRIFVAGGQGLVGSAIVRRLQADGFEPMVAGRDELDLLDQQAVGSWFAENKVDIRINILDFEGKVVFDSDPT